MMKPPTLIEAKPPATPLCSDLPDASTFTTPMASTKQATLCAGPTAPQAECFCEQVPLLLVATSRRPGVATHSRLAQGPGNLGKALGLLIEHNHSHISQDPTDAEAGFLLVSPDEPVDYMTGPRIGISKNTEPHWRFWIPGDPTVSKKRR